MSEETFYPLHMTKTQVHIVFKDSSDHYSGNEFVGVFFDRKSAEEWIAGRSKSRSHRYFIETYEQPEQGMAHEVFD